MVKAKAKGYGQRLKELRERAGLTGRECAETYLNSIGRNTENVHKIETRWFRYEGKDYEKRKIPWRVIEPIIGKLAGRGHPPVERAELIEIAQIPEQRASALLKADTSQPGIDTLPSPARGAVIQTTFLREPAERVLRVKARAEKGAYMTAEASCDRDFGPAPIAYANDLVGDQFCAIDVDGGWYPPNTVLHCEDATLFSWPELVGRKVLLFVDAGFGGVGNLVVAKLVAADNNSAEFEDEAGNSVSGELKAVIRGSYIRE